MNLLRRIFIKQHIILVQESFKVENEVVDNDALDRSNVIRNSP